MNFNGNQTFRGFIDLVKNELRNAVAHNLASAPSSPSEGQWYWNTAGKTWEVWNGSSWITLAQGSGYSDEQSRDAIGTAIAAGTQSGLTVNYDDALDQFSFTVTNAPLLGGQNSAYHLARANHTGTQSADTLTNGTANKVFLAAEQTKLAGIATGATANTGDVAGPASAVNNEVALYSGTTGKLLGRATGTGVAKLTSGVLSTGVVAITEGGTGAITAPAALTALGAAPLASPTFTGTVSGVTKAHVGLANVDNTSDAAKPVSTAQQTALDLKAPIASPTLTGIPAAPTAAAATSTTQLATTAFVTTADNLKANLASPTFTGTVVVPTAVGATSPVTKAQLDAVSQGVFYKVPARVATTGAITLSAPQTIDGVSVIAGNRVLVKDQASAATNGIYTVAAGAWTRGAGADTAAEITAGATVFVDEGTANGNTQWTQTDTVTTLGTSPITWVKTFQAQDLTGQAVTKKYAANFGNGSATSFTITHNLGTTDVQVQIRLVATGEVEGCDPVVTDANTVTLSGWATAPASNAYRVVVVG